MNAAAAPVSSTREKTASCRRHGGSTVRTAQFSPTAFSEMIAESQLIVGWDAEPSDVAHHIHAHPTLSEAVGEAFLTLAGRCLHQQV